MARFKESSSKKPPAYIPCDDLVAKLKQAEKNKSQIARKNFSLP